LAIELDDGLLIIDDLKGRKFAHQLGLTIIGTIGVIVDAKLSGIIPSVIPILSKIKSTNFRITEQKAEKWGEFIAAHILDDRQRTANVVQGIEFEDRELPEEFALIDANMPVHYQYLRNRCVPEDYPVGMIHGRPDDKFSRRQGVIIPFTYDGRIVGHTRRFFDDHNPRYVHDLQPGYVFGTDLQRPDWQHAIVVEGVFDALSISGLAVLHADISDAQARLIRSLGREVTVVPDQDSAGMKLVDRAIELGWAVSIPEWPESCKDVNDAVKLFGRLGTLLTIMQARETSKIKIEIRKKRLAKKIS
jgi:hypothetical protein